MSAGLLLDTHALIWAFNNGDLSRDALKAIDRVWADGGQVLVSKISAWEVGMLVSRGRLSLPTSPSRWFNGALETPGFALADLTPEIMVDASFLPDSTMRDPADQSLVATARALNLPIVTRDRVIVAYASAGHVRAIVC